VATELGVRWDRQDHTGDSQLGPRFHLLWRPASSTDFRCALGWYSQSQRVHELQVEDGETEFWPAEMARQAEATFRYELPSGARLRVDAYYRELSDLRPRYENLFQPLDLFPETSEDRVAVAPTEARLRGIELLVSGDPRERFVWWMSYTRSDARDRIDDAWAPRSWDQPHAGKFLVGYQWHGWLVSLAGTAHTGWPTTPVTAVGTQQPDGSIEVEAIPGVRNSARLPAYSRFDLKLRRSFALRGGQLSLTLDVINLTDRENVCCVDDFLFGAPAVGPVEVEPELGSWLGLTPTFQVRWEF
jgi:outer membrane receptor protein involved in Fe transport